MLKQITIKSCQQCPYEFENKHGDGQEVEDGLCCHPSLNPSKNIEDVNTLPDFCPLEDKQ